MNSQFTTPILLIVFNRPIITQKSFDQIKNIRPKHLFIAADGPRFNRPDDVEKCAATRKIVKQIDWPCELKTLFRDDNRGCGYGPAEAITWFFEQVEMGIILEDDCLPDKSFFPFCEEILQKYKNDPRVSMIGGTNLLLEWKKQRQSYLFSKIGMSWGWAGWRRSWQHFDYNASLWDKPEIKDRVRNYLVYDSFYKHFSSEFNTYFNEVRPDVWDFQWLFSRFLQEGLTILPTVNLISNIGFDEDSTHTFKVNPNYSNLPINEIDFPLRHPTFKVDKIFDRYVFERFINNTPRSLAKRILLKVAKEYINHRRAPK